MANQGERRTALEEVISAFDLKPAAIVRTADRIAAERGVGSISRAHLLRLRKGLMAATEEKILILVSTIREMTGVAFGAGELFALEPAPAGAPVARPWHGDGVHASVSSPATRIAHLWRVLVAEETASSSDQSFEELYVEHGALLCGIAIRGYGIPADDAEALAHDCFIAYLQRHTTIRNVRGWLSETMRNSCRHYLRERKREAPLGSEHDGTVDTAAQASLDSWIRKLTLATVLARIGARCREMLRAHYLTDEPHESIADRLSTTHGYVAKVLSKCRKKAHELFLRSQRRQ